MIFQSRTEAGEELATKLSEYANRADVLVLAIPRGGVVVAAPIASSLDVPLYVYVSRKLPLPWEPEAGFGAVAEDGTVAIDRTFAKAYLTEDEIKRITARVLKEVKRRANVYRSEQLPVLHGKTVILVDDGLATGWTVAAAIKALRKLQPAEIVVATPCAANAAYEMIKKMADRVICLIISKDPVFAVASFYKEFPELTDDEVLEALAMRQKA
jgi:putative phosphoribosyl transferase